MNNDVAIKIENLGKKYIISHEGKDNASYKTLRETLSNLFKFKKSQKAEKEEFWALKDFNLEIKKGEKIAVIGRNGAGKSTLLKLLSRVTEPTTGKAMINGRVASLLEVGTGFHPELTGRENIYLNGVILGMTKKEITKKFEEIVEFSGCEKFLDTPIKRYSSGMKVRLGFAVAAFLESEILIVDEVLAVGDAEFQKKCLGKMDEISKGEGRTIIFVSHNMSAVQNLCDKGVVLDKGEVKFVGDVNKAITNYNLMFSENASLKDDYSNDNLYFNSDVIIETVDYKDLFNNSVNKLDVFESYYIEIGLKIKKWSDNYKIGFNIYSKNGECIVVLADNTYAFSNYKDKDIGNYTIRFKFFNVLSPGEYICNIGIKNQTDSVNLIKGIPFIVSDKINMANPYRQEGVVQFKCEIDLNKR